MSVFDLKEFRDSGRLIEICGTKRQLSEPVAAQRRRLERCRNYFGDRITLLDVDRQEWAEKCGVPTTTIMCSFCRRRRVVDSPYHGPYNEKGAGPTMTVEAGFVAPPCACGKGAPIFFNQRVAHNKLFASGC